MNPEDDRITDHQSSKSRTFLSRSVRARRRRAFLRTYQLSSLHKDSVTSETEPNRCHEKMREASNKLKSVVVSFVDTARVSLLKKGCSFRSLICASSLNSTPSIRLG